MKLTPQQVAAAKARGFVMFPATQGQIDRMTMQRRVFDLDGRPHVVSRDGLYFETHATLAPVIADAETFLVAPTPNAAPVPATLAAPPAPVSAPPVSPTLASSGVIPAPEPTLAVAPAPAAPPTPVAAVPAEAAPELPLAAEPSAEPAEVPAPRAPRRRLAAKPEAEGEPRKPARRRTMVERAEELFSPPPEPEPGHVATEHTLSLPVDDSLQGTEAAARRRQRVADAPRWQVAGAMRRGRQPRAT